MRKIQNFSTTRSRTKLKTPLTSGREFISIVMDGLAGPLNETQTEIPGNRQRELQSAPRLHRRSAGCDPGLKTGKLAIEIKKPTCLTAVVQRAVTNLNASSSGEKD